MGHFEEPGCWQLMPKRSSYEPRDLHMNRKNASVADVLLFLGGGMWKGCMLDLTNVLIFLTSFQGALKGRWAQIDMFSTVWYGIVLGNPWKINTPKFQYVNIEEPHHFWPHKSWGIPDKYIYTQVSIPKHHHAWRTTLFLTLGSLWVKKYICYIPPNFNTSKSPKPW